MMIALMLEYEMEVLGISYSDPNLKAFDVRVSAQHLLDKFKPVKVSPKGIVADPLAVRNRIYHRHKRGLLRTRLQVRRKEKCRNKCSTEGEF